MRVSWNMGCQVTLWLCQNSYWTSPLLMGKSTINGHFHGKIHYKWPFSWENPLLMVIFNSYFDITRGYPMKVWFRPLHSSWSVRAMWSAQQKLAFSVCFQGRVEIPMVFFSTKELVLTWNSCFIFLHFDCSKILLSPTGCCFYQIWVMLMISDYELHDFSWVWTTSPWSASELRVTRCNMLTNCWTCWTNMPRPLRLSCRPRGFCQVDPTAWLLVVPSFDVKIQEHHL